MKLYQAVILSIWAHITFMLIFKGDLYLFETKEREPIEWIEADENDPLMGEETKRVEKETRVRETSNAPVQSLRTPPASLAPSMNDQFGDQRDQGQLQDNIVMDSSSFLTSGNAGGNLPMGQKIDSFLPKDLEIGDIVALNTDQNLYYSFYRRMAEKVLWPWVQNVIVGFEQLKRDQMIGSARKKWVTIVEVVLDKDGQVLSTQPLKLAGTWEIDGAPIKAFKVAKKFPNPPKGMVEEDGYIRIRYQFVVYYDPK